MEESPGSRSEIKKKLSDAYEIAGLSTGNETGLDESTFPESCGYSLEEA